MQQQTLLREMRDVMVERVQKKFKVPQTGTGANNPG
jgi:hypothetical protein